MVQFSRLIPLVATAILATVGTASAQQVLRVGLQDSEPGVIHNDNQLGGRDIDIWDAIAKDSGLRVTYVLRDNSPQLLAALDEGKIDVVGRYCFSASIYWAEEVMLFLMVGCVFLGNGVVAWSGRQIRMDVVVGMMPEKVREAHTFDVEFSVQPPPDG